MGANSCLTANYIASVFFYFNKPVTVASVSRCITMLRSGICWAAIRHIGIIPSSRSQGLATHNGDCWISRNFREAKCMGFIGCETRMVRGLEKGLLSPYPKRPFSPSSIFD
jgi:hypothetical protein